MRLTEAERDGLDKCECGHWASEHLADGCTIPTPEEDGGHWEKEYGDWICWCHNTPDAIRLAAVEALVADRDQAWRDKLRATAHELDRIASDCRDKRLGLMPWPRWWVTR